MRHETLVQCVYFGFGYSVTTLLVLVVSRQVAMVFGTVCDYFDSVNPVKIYVYEEGLVRFATVVSSYTMIQLTGNIFRAGHATTPPRQCDHVFRLYKVAGYCIITTFVVSTQS